jgi:hypothetical protein
MLQNTRQNNLFSKSEESVIQHGVSHLDLDSFLKSKLARSVVAFVCIPATKEAKLGR